MNAEFIKANCQVATYALKEGTKSSYYWAAGFSGLPNRLSIQDAEMTKVSKSGRNSRHRIAGQMIGEFTQKETSMYKRNKPFVCRTQIWGLDDYPSFIGYGTAGISNEQGMVEDTGDLLVFHTPDNWEHIRIYRFAGMGNPDGLMEAMEYAYNHLPQE